MTTDTEHGTNQSETSGRIWVVDDEESVARFIGALVEIKGHRPELFHDSAKVLEHFEQEPDSVDLVITDQTMPGMTGVELAKSLWAIRSDLPVILCSGFSEDVDSQRARILGFKGYLQKPLDTSQLLNLVGDVLAGRTKIK